MVITYYYNPEATAGLSSTEHLLNTRLISSVSRIAYLADFMEPASGIEPPTCGLRSGPEAISTPYSTPLKHTEDPDPPLG